MEEKVLALEGLGAVRGFFSQKWNAHSSSPIKKEYTTDTESNAFLKNNKHVTSLEGNSSQLIIPDIRKDNFPKAYDVETKNSLLKPCKRTEINESESDIPKCDKPVMNINCDKRFLDCNEKTKEQEKFGLEEITSAKPREIIKENLCDEYSENIQLTESEEASHLAIKKISPSAVQEWVNHLPSKDNTSLKENSDSKEPKETQEVSKSEENRLMRAQLSREVSLQSSSSLDSLLDSRRPDPVEIFLNLGFGGLPGVDTENCRIPKRFLVPSKCKGGDWNEFLKRELLQAQNFECSSLGFRGLSGPSYRRPSAIVANIMEKLRERAVSQPHNRSRFSAVAKMVLNEKSVLNKLTPEFQSVLSPDSRKFLQNQGKKSPEVPRRRIIFGQKSFAFGHDGEFVEVDSSSTEEKKVKECPTIVNMNNAAEESPAFPNSDVLLKLRRSSLQKQKNVEEDDDTDVDDVFFVVGNENSKEPSFNNNECSKKTGKIPRRFLSSSNLVLFEENNETMRLEVEREILSLSQKIKSISSQDLPSVLQQVKEIISKIEKGGQEESKL